MGLFSNNGRYLPIGVDIKGSAVYAVQFTRRSGAIRVHTKARQRLPDGSDREETIAALRQLTKANPFVGRDTITVLPRDQLDIRPVQLPPDLTPDQGDLFEEAVRAQAFVNLPYSEEDAVLEYLPLGLDETRAEPHFMILIIAARRESVQAHLSLFEEAGLDCLHLDVGPCAAARIFADTDNAFALMELDSRSTSISILRGQHLLFSRTVDFGLNHLADDLAERLNLEPEEAAELIDAVGFDHRGSCALNIDQAAETGLVAAEALPAVLFEICHGSLNQLAEELRRSLDYFGHNYWHDTVTRVVVTGDPIPENVVEFWSERLGIPVVLGGWIAEPRMAGEKAAAESSAYAVAAGLAIRGEGV